MDPSVILLVFITLLAALINGGLGYGFSSLTVPVALLFYTNRVLNPAIVLIEVIINAYILVLHIKTVKTIAKRILPLVIGAVPGVLIGAMLLSSINPNSVKLITYALFLPLILLQAAGIQRAVQSERIAGLFCGGGVGFFYAITTISGPPLAILLTNQGLAQKEFRAAISMTRLVLSSLAVITYLHFGLFQEESLLISAIIAPGVFVGIPIGAYLIRKVNPETFRRICISFDAWVVGFGLSYVVAQMGILSPPYAYIFLSVAALIDGYLLCQYFSRGRSYTLPAREASAERGKAF